MTLIDPLILIDGRVLQYDGRCWYLDWWYRWYPGLSEETQTLDNVLSFLDRYPQGV